jgi:PAS domain-containing protein
MTTIQPNFRSSEALIAGAQSAWHRLFEHSPVPVLLLTPNLKIIDANESYLREVLRSRDALAGLDMFDAFPDNPHIARADGVSNLAASFEKVLHDGCGHVMPLQRYDIRPDGRPWQVRYWLPKNWPVVDEKGSIVALVHHVTDATAAVLTPKPGATVSVLMKPNAFSLDPLQRADKAILEARETVRETQEAILRTRAKMEVVSSRRLMTKL